MIGDVEVRDAGSKGRGVYARRAFDHGEFIFRRRHTRILTAAELERAVGTVVGSFFAMDPERQTLLVPHAPAFIRREYHRRRRD